MSSSKNLINSLYYWNGFMRFSLLLFIIFYVSIQSCVSIKSNGDRHIERVTEGKKKNTEYKRSEIISSARKYIGSDYLGGGKSPLGFDCSGFTYFIMKENGIYIGPSSRSQAIGGKAIEIKELKPGDLVFFGREGIINHVGIVSKNNRDKLNMIHASSSRGIVEENIWNSSYWSQRIITGRNYVD